MFEKTTKGTSGNFFRKLQGNKKRKRDVVSNKQHPLQTHSATDKPQKQYCGRYIIAGDVPARDLPCR